MRNQFEHSLDNRRTDTTRIDVDHIGIRLNDCFNDSLSIFSCRFSGPRLKKSNFSTTIDVDSRFILTLHGQINTQNRGFGKVDVNICIFSMIDNALREEHTVIRIRELPVDGNLHTRVVFTAPRLNVSLHPLR